MSAEVVPLRGPPRPERIRKRAAKVIIAPITTRLNMSPDRVLKGAVGYDALKQAIDQARGRT